MEIELDDLQREWRATFRIPLETPRLLLRPLQDGDAEWLQEPLSDPEVCRFLWDEPSAMKARQAAEGMIEFDHIRCQFGCWAIQEKESGTFHGWAELSKLRGWEGPSDEIALSYVLRRGSWGRGIATEAGTRLMRHAFEVHELPRVMASIMSGNAASRRVLEKLGMREVLTRETDRGVTLVYFGIEADEFRRRINK